MQIRLMLLCLLWALLMPGAGYAQFNPSPNDPQAPVEIPRFNGNMKDFEEVEFLCYSQAAGDYISTALCEAADNEARKAARDNDLRFRVSGGREDAKSFTLYVYITSAGVAPRAMSIRVEASKFMKEAVDKEASYLDPASAGRTGKLVMFENTITGVGYRDNLESQLRHDLRRVIRDFFESKFGN